jgi:GLPGLI family protein
MINIMAQKSFFPKLPRNLSSLSIVDSGNIKIYYILNKYQTSERKNRQHYMDQLDSVLFDCYICGDDIHILEIGKTLSKYYSYNVFLGDSIATDFGIKKPLAQSIPNRNGSNPTISNKYFWSELYKYYATNILTEYAYMPANIPDYYYSEEIPDFAWTIKNDTLTVAGYLCQKATCTFRGYNYTAWFAQEIPINNGPWKFSGLPGLILKIYDEDNSHVFECIGINYDKNEFSITSYNYGNYKKIKREKLLKLWTDIFDHYFQMVGVTTMSGFPYLPKEKVSYSPLELE